MSTAIPTLREASARVRLPRLDGDGPHAVSVGGVDLVVVRTAAGLRAFQGLCPHRGALLGEGELSAGELICRNHRWRFDAIGGRRLDGPGCLIEYPLFELDGETWVELPTSPAGPDLRSRRRTLAELPGPSGLPVLGNLLSLDLGRFHQVLEGWAAECGPIYRFRMGAKTFLAISDPDLCEDVLRRRPEVFRRLSAVRPVFREMGASGVFSAEGAEWRPLRRLSMEALSYRHLRDFYPTLAAAAGKLRDRWRRLAAAGAVIDVVEDLKRFTVDVTTLLTLGYDVATLDQGEDVIQRRLEQIFPALNRRIFALFPTWRYLRMPADRRLDRALAELREWMGGLVRSARERLAREPDRGPRPANFLEAMVAARDEDGRPFADEVIFGNLLTMLLAGEDTTAYTLSWAVHELCDCPEAVAALRCELAAELGADSVPATFDVANGLAVAGAIANETMRLRPVAPLLGVCANVDTEIADVAIPARTEVFVLLRPAVQYAAHFVDPLAFRPQRWIAPTGAHDAAAHMPFGSGPRLCPGRTLALLEMKLALATIYQSFDIVRRGPRAAVREQLSFTMQPVGLEVALHPRASPD